MVLGTDQLNTFDTFTLHCRKDRVYHADKEFPAGHFAAEILNFAGEVHDPLLERITALTTLVDGAVWLKRTRAADCWQSCDP